MTDRERSPEPTRRDLSSPPPQTPLYHEAKRRRLQGQGILQPLSLNGADEARVLAGTPGTVLGYLTQLNLNRG